MKKLQADWLNAPGTRAVFAILNAAGFSAYAVGGCVRNTLLGVPVKDIDLSTDATPTAVMALAKQAGLRAIPTGIDHGTVTVVSDDLPHEITTYRRDVATDGRRAVVAFSTDINDDARRRDFTMNALYADASGAVVDPLCGLPDLQARRVRFIEDADQRIREDYLRSLRFFRFHAWYGDTAKGFDPDALDAIARNIDGIATLSHERVGVEMLRLLEAPDPVAAVAGMRSTGVLQAVLDSADDRALGPLVHLESTIQIPPDAIRRLACIGGEDVAEKLRLSRQDAERLRILMGGAQGDPKTSGYKLGEANARDVHLIEAASLGAALEPSILDKIKIGAAQTFPIKAADLMPNLQGPALGAALKALEGRWIESDFLLSRADLLGELGKEG
ncbi:MAG: CCA tRNA nucleotidyltransferase [Silicimonas sp.]|nr:CCA tRNA nucleotidyltransferase [Silicimonas sp.]